MIQVVVNYRWRYIMVSLLWFFRRIHAGDPLCDQSPKTPTGECCPRTYAPYCCPGIPVCADGLTDPVVSGVTSGCDAPWELNGCLPGFYSPDGNTTLPCPPGFFCQEDEVCLKPCPSGALCIQTQLQYTNCSDFDPCCSPGMLAPIYDKRSGKLLCQGPAYPAKCLSGYYCPNTTTLLKCPSGYFCREGFKEPVKCPVLSSCGEGETSANTLLAGLIVNGCLLLIFAVTTISFANRREIKFYFNLKRRRLLGTRTLSQRYNLSDGIRLAITRLPDLDDTADGLDYEPKKRTYDISFENLSLKLKGQPGVNKDKVILQGVTGELKAGQVTAVLGPSGSGKTTFLNTLCGKAYYGERGGTVRINGVKVEGVQHYKILTGFVPQEDIMHRSLTVAEVLHYNAMLRLQSKNDPKYPQKMVKKVLNLLGIRHIAHSIIGDEETRGISGGQRRRVNIGMELVTDPSILFLDEPTTGLDSSSSLAIVRALNTIASKARVNVMCVIHQPRHEILEMFDKVLFLGSGGRTVYSGTVDGAKDYFANIGFSLPPYMNPFDFYMDVILGAVKQEDDSYTDLSEEWKTHQMRSELESVEDLKREEYGGERKTAWGEKGETEGDGSAEVGNGAVSPAGSSAYPECASIDPTKPVPRGPHVGPGFFTQLKIFLMREFVLQLHTINSLLLDNALLLLAGAVLGLLFREVNIQSVVESNIFGNIGVGLVAVLGALRSFGTNRVVYWRESAAGINRFSYFFAVNLAHIPMLLVSPAVYLSLFYSLAAFLAPFWQHYLIFVCAWFYLSGLGYVLSLILTPRNSQMATIIAVVVLAMLSGATAELCTMDDAYVGPFVYNLSFSRWLAEAIFEIEAKQLPGVHVDVISHIQSVEHYDLESYNICVIALLSMGFGLRVIALLLLLFTHRGQQK